VCNTRFMPIRSDTQLGAKHLSVRMKGRGREPPKGGLCRLRVCESNRHLTGGDLQPRKVDVRLSLVDGEPGSGPRGKTGLETIASSFEVVELLICQPEFIQNSATNLQGRRILAPD